MSQPPLTDRSAQIKQQIQRIELMLQELDLYSEQRPDDRAFTSTAPFCYDTMSFLEWLQWVMFPRACEMIDKSLPLPTVCEIHPLAEEEFKLIVAETDTLLAEIRALDRLFNVAH